MSISESFGRSRFARVMNSPGHTDFSARLIRFLDNTFTTELRDTPWREWLDKTLHRHGSGAL